jgi:hypothetical protein
MLEQASQAVDEASRRLAEAQVPLTALDQMRATATVGEAAALRAEIAKLRQAHDAVLSAWSEGGCVGDRPSHPDELLPLERRLGEIARAAVDAEPKLRAANAGVAAAAERVSEATWRRDEAVAGALVEASAGALLELTEAIKKVLRVEVKLWSIVEAAREIASRQSPGSGGYGIAAERIERSMRSARGDLTLPKNIEFGRRLIAALKGDATASL